jgi:hypothetical protein
LADQAAAAGPSNTASQLQEIDEAELAAADNFKKLQQLQHVGHLCDYIYSALLITLDQEIRHLLRAVKAIKISSRNIYKIVRSVVGRRSDQ